MISWNLGKAFNYFPVKPLTYKTLLGYIFYSL